MTLDLCRALCACGCGFEIDALDAPVEAHAPAASPAGAASLHDEAPAHAIREADEIAPTSEAPRRRGEPPPARGSTPPAPAAYASERTPRR
jgi:hypothetical protein